MTGPPNAGKGPGKGPHQSALVKRLEDRPYSWGTSGSPTLAYLEGRERVGRQRAAHPLDPDEFADWLADEIGPAAARAWGRRLVRRQEVSL